MPSPNPIEAIVFDFSRVILFPRDASYKASLNALHRQLLAEDPQYPFLDHFRLNTELLGCLKQITGPPLYILTSSVIQESPAVKQAIKQVFKAVYSAERLGVKKSEPSSYGRLCQELGAAPERVLFIDDSTGNIDAAKQAGLQTHRYHDNQELTAFLRASKLI
jgi:HAD superfamily hydrolase (TIGR01549 family)